MFNEQIKRQEINDMMSPDGTFTECIQELLDISNIPCFLSNLIGQNITLHHQIKTRLGRVQGTSTTYTSIKGYDIEPKTSTIKLFVNCPMNHFSALTLKKEETSTAWCCLGKDDSVYIKMKNVFFNSKIMPQHRKVFATVGLPEKNIIGRKFYFLEQNKGREIASTIDSVTIVTKPSGATTVKIIPSFCAMDLHEVNNFSIVTGEELWSVSPGRTMAKIITL